MNVYLGDIKIELIGKRPQTGFSLQKTFSIPAAYNAKRALKNDSLKKGWVIISTLPNIRSNECSMQILNLENEIKKLNEKIRIFHIACDSPDHWEGVKELHPSLKAKGFCLNLAAKKDVMNFKESFGVGVKGSERIAHGLFAFRDGKLIGSLIPKQQYGIPNIKGFLKSLGF